MTLPDRFGDMRGALSLRKLYRRGLTMLEHSGIQDAGSDAWILLEAAFDLDRQSYLMSGEEPADPRKAALYMAWISRRAERIPVQYITGEAWFCGQRFLVTPDVLIPRLDTEVLVEEARHRMMPGMRILDLCTGSGCILLTLLREGNVSGCGADISEKAVEVARENGRRMCLEAEWIRSNLFDGICGTYDLIVSNPPYIASDVIPTLDPEVCMHEPHLALDGGQDGLGILRTIIREAPAHLSCGGWLLLEIGYDQGEAVRLLLGQAGFKQTEILPDLAGRDRAAVGRKTDV